MVREAFAKYRNAVGAACWGIALALMWQDESRVFPFWLKWIIVPTLLGVALFCVYPLLRREFLEINRKPTLVGFEGNSHSKWWRTALLLLISLAFGVALFMAGFSFRSRAVDVVAERNVTMQKALKKCENELATKDAFLKAMAREKAELQRGIAPLTDVQLRIKAIREEFLEHAERAPSKEHFTAELGKEWYIVASTMVEETLDHMATNLHLMGFGYSPETSKYEHFLRSVGGLRAIAVNLTEGDLTQPTPRELAR